MKILQRRVIAGKCDPTPYMIRWYLFDCRFGGVMLHRFFRSDDDRDLHDHPWAFLSIILRGGYNEETSDGLKWYKPGSFLFRRADWAHAIRLRPGTEGYVWSLVIKGPIKRQWGFYPPSGWVFWKNYLDAKECD